MNTPKKLVAGNWKMNGLLQNSLAEATALDDLIKDGTKASCDILICPPATILSALAQLPLKNIQFGAQDCHTEIRGAHTGDISAEMLKDAGASHVIVGHSERRADHGEKDALVKAKAESAHRAGLVAIVCVGETEAERDAGKTEAVVLGQVSDSLPAGTNFENTVIAYEPVWAIGTGKTPTVADVEEIHTAIRNRLVGRFGAAGTGFSILYGGSVKPSNAVELMAAKNVDGALVGGASLKASDFNGIIEAYRN